MTPIRPVDPGPVASACANPLRRQGLLSLAALAAAPWLVSGCAEAPAARSTASANQETALPQAYRLANRVSWGATDAELARVRSLGADGYIAQQLNAAAGPLPGSAQAQIDALRIQQHQPLGLWSEIDAAHKAGLALPDQAARKAAQDAFQQAMSKLARESATRDLLRALYSPNQLQEQLQWFWFNHFNVHQYKSNIRVLLGDYQEQAIRPHTLGRFRDLLGAVTRHPAMLRYLDNEQNAGGRINENHARELLELHSLGVDGGYTQRDVQELARVLTGHGVNFSDKTPAVKRELASQYLRSGIYEFNPGRHDYGDKLLLGHTIRGCGAAELDEVLDLLATHPATARFVCHKLARQLLADEPPQAVVGAMTSAWARSGGHIADVLGALLRAPEFAAPGPGKFKDPVHYVVSAVRACYGDRVVLNTGPMQGWLNRMGQGLYSRQTPDGYPAVAMAWTGSGQLAARLDIARALASGSAGLFKSDDAAMPREQPAFPQLMRPVYWQAVRPGLAMATREALDAAATPQDWNTLYLSAPEFMYT